jgi:ankyrin repeat protein
VVRVLLKLGADINEPSCEGVTPLVTASIDKQHEIFKAGADTQVFFCNRTNFTADLV